MTRSALPCPGVLVAFLVFSTASCGIGRDSRDYHAFVASHDAIRPGMSIRQVFESGLADYLVRLGGKNLPGATAADKQPVSPECRRYVVDIHHGPGDATTRGGFSLKVYCNMNAPSSRQVAAPALFATKRDFLDGLDHYASWTMSMVFRVESPALQIGGVYDSYEFSMDGSARVATVSPIRKSSP
jgi:hypothetical protein